MCNKGLPQRLSLSPFLLGLMSLNHFHSENVLNLKREPMGPCGLHSLELKVR